jgi:hypothetical protein
MKNIARMLAICVVAAGAVAAVSALPGAESATRKACPTDGRTIVANEQVRVFRRVSTRDRVYACLVKTGKLRKLGERDELGAGVRMVRVARAHVAWDAASCGSGSCVGDMFTLDMRSGKLRRGATQGDEGLARDVELTNSGAIAWTRSSAGEDYEPRVYKLDAAGQGVLDSGPGVDRESLGTDGGRVYWTSGDAPRSTLLQ